MRVQEMRASNTVEVARIPNCDFCEKDGAVSAACVDGATVLGPWAHMCSEHFLAYGRGLGCGVGQRLVVASS